MLGKTASLQIKTPEGVSFTLPLASPVARGLAAVLDFFFMAVILITCYVLQLVVVSFVSMLPVVDSFLSDFSLGLLIIFQFLLFMLYGAFFEWRWKGQTIGKRLLNLRVIDERGLSLTLGQIVIRNLFRWLDILPSLFYFVGAISCTVTKRCQRIGDVAAGTVVVRELKVAQPEIDELLDEIDNSFATLPHIEARLRQNSGPDDARIALDAVLRRSELGKDERLKVFTAIADHFREMADFPEEITIGLSDEQYVRNVVDTLFRRAGN